VSPLKGFIIIIKGPLTIIHIEGWKQKRSKCY